MIIYNISDLPKDGWIQRCYLCYHCTSNTIPFIDTLTNKKHTVYLCRNCLKIHNSKTLTNNISLSLTKRIRDYIFENTLEPYKPRVISLDPPKITLPRGEPKKPPIYPIENNDITPPKIDTIKNIIVVDNKELSPTTAMYMKV